MSESVAQGLDRATLGQLSLRAFCSKPGRLEECAGEYPRELLCETLQHLAADLSRLLRTLPDAAFEMQPDDVDGSDVWSAGQVAGHLADMEVTSLPVWETILDRRLDPPADAVLNVIDRRLPDRQQATDAAEAIERSFEALTAAILAQPENNRTAAHFVIGMVGVAGALLGACIHLADHLGQLEELARAVPSD